MYTYWSCRSMASEWALPARASSTALRTMTNPMPGTPSRHFPLAAISASNGVVRASIGSAANELIASTISPFARFAHTAAIEARSLRTPAPVSQWTCATCVIDGSAASAASTMAPVTGWSSGTGRSTTARPRTLQILTMRAQYAPLFGTSTLPARGTTVPIAASTENVPLPCSGTHVYSAPPPTISTRSLRRLAVIALKAESHEPQSFSIACLVRSDVVSGPGVSRIGSLPRIMSVSFGLLPGVAPRLRAPDQPPLGREHHARDDRRRQDDQRRHRRRRPDRTGFVELQDGDRRERGLR